MISRKLAGFSAAGVGAATAVAALLLGAATGNATAGTSSAYAISAEGLLPISAMPVVETTSGEVLSDEVAGTSAAPELEAAGVSVGLLTAGVGPNTAESSVVDVEITGLLDAEVIRTSCDNGEGGLEIINGELAGNPLPDTSVPSETVDLAPLATVELNKQTTGEDGSLTVEGIVITVLPGAATAQVPAELADAQAALQELLAQAPAPTDGEALQTITIGHASCSAGEDGDGDDESPAPAPEPIETNLPVTG